MRATCCKIKAMKVRFVQWALLGHLLAVVANSGQDRVPGENDVASPVAFSAARSQPLKGHKQKQDSLAYDHIFFNRGGYFEPRTGVFTTPQDGVYEFTFSGGALPHKRMSLQLMKNHFEVQTLAYDGHRKRRPHVQSQKMIVQLLQGDRIWIRLAASRQYGVVGARGSAYVTTFTGHLLQDTFRHHDVGMRLDGISLTSIQSATLPHNNDVTDDVVRKRAKRLVTEPKSNFVAFSVARTTSIIGYDVNRTRNQPSYDGLMTYDKVFVNAGDAFNVTSGQFKAPTSGLYYISFTVGKYPEMKLSVSMMKNNNEFQVMVYDESASKRRHMQSQNLILPLLVGDTVWLKSYNADGYAVYSNLGNYITFNGYLLQVL